MECMGRTLSPLSEILRRVLPTGSRHHVPLGLIRLKWSAVVGKELALRSEPTSLGVGVLTVTVNDAAWGRMILKLEREILARIGTVVGPDAVEKLQFIAREKPIWEGGAPSLRWEHPVVEPPPPSERIVKAARTIEDAGLRDQVIRTASRYLAAQADRRR